MDFRSLLFIPVFLLFACSNSEHIAKVGNETISSDSFEAYLEFKRIDPSDSDRVNVEMDRFVERMALAKAIENSPLIDTDLLAAEVAEFKRQILISRYMTAYLDKAVTDDAIANYYTANQSEFSRKTAKIAHIVFRVAATSDQNEQDIAMQSARNVIAKLMKGESFEDLARQYSEDVLSKEKGGVLGWVEPESVDPEFSKVIPTMAAGEVSDIVKTRYGYHIIKLLEPISETVMPLQQVSGDIRYTLRQKAKVTETERLLNSVKTSKSE